MLNVVSGSFMSSNTFLQHDFPELKSSQGSQYILTQQLRYMPENISVLHRVGKGHILHFRYSSPFSASRIFLVSWKMIILLYI